MDERPAELQPNPASTTLAGRATRRTALGGIAAGGLAALAAGGSRPARAQDAMTTEETLPPSLPPFVYRLEASEPQIRPAGTLRTATRANIPALSGVAIYSEVIEPGGMRELHWHANANELSVCLSGEGEVGILTGRGEKATFPVRAGSVTSVPLGYAHYLRNIGADPLRFVIAFSNEVPDSLDLSGVLPWFPGEIINQAVAGASAGLPFLPLRGDQAIVPVAPSAGPPPDSGATFTVNEDQVQVQTFAGGTARPVHVEDLAALQDLTIFFLTIDPFGLREPHWHTNASELNYCVSGLAQIGLVAPNGGAQTFTVGPGDVAYLPANWFHYIASISDEPLDLLIFFTNPAPDHIDLSQMTDYFAPEVLAASFGLDPAVFAALPKLGDVFVAAPRPTPEPAPAATPAS
jgi:oxalate decarboxylase